MSKKEKGEKEIMEDDLEKFAELAVLSETKAGKLLVENLIKDVVRHVETLCVKHSELEREQFIALSVQIKEKLDLAHTLTRAEKNKKFVSDEIEALLKNTLQE